MSHYSFRIRFVIAPGESIEIDKDDIDLSDFYPHPLRLLSGNPGKSVKEASDLVLRASGFSTEAEARDAGEQCRDFFTVVFAQLRIGVDFGDRAPRSGFFRPGLEFLEKQIGERVLNDQQGVMTFRSDPSPRFARLGSPRIIRGRTEAKFFEVLSRAAQGRVHLTNRERLAYDLFSASYFQHSQDARLLLLVIALESLLSLQPRAGAALAHVEDLIELTRTSADLSQSERNSILGSLRWLKTESIGESARRLLTDRLSNHQYMGMSPGRFFKHCYELRSRLVHGSEPFPSRDDVATASANLETMVGDVLSQPYIKAAS